MAARGTRPDHSCSGANGGDCIARVHGHGVAVCVVKAQPGEAPMLAAAGIPSEHPNVHAVFAFPGW